MKKVILAGALGIAALAGTNLPGLETIKASAAVEKIQDNQMLHQGKYLEENNAFEYEIGKVTNVYEVKYIVNIDKYATFEYTGKNGEKLQIPVFLTKGQKFNIGDKVKVDMRTVFRASNRWVEDGIEKINDSKTAVSNEDQWVWDYTQKNNNELAPGFYEKQKNLPDYAIGKITKVDKGLYGPEDQTDYVVVKAPNKFGEEKSIYVVLTEGQKFVVGDKVKVDFHDGSDFHGMTIETENYIKKIDNVNNQIQSNGDWVWGS
ncbi:MULTISPECIES: ATP synthase F0F1 subunit alpha [Bacillus cereus group]|uniref:ATP synthase F0F1 subunit alpha n=1 Tax=Bacillus cereus group TaxID=86661 RepID=UPI0018F47607|nr:MULTISPECIES: ATP synthase F0F1 subunit alpha [Bacillus cereus group]MBJ8154263.1 ATP synthase F0F1 subunit alpha [Bacillus cereus]